MQEAKTLILEREDLLSNEQNTNIRILELNHFKTTLSVTLNYDIVLFIDKDIKYKYIGNNKLLITKNK
jgi:hypothetical protein